MPAGSLGVFLSDSSKADEQPGDAANVIAFHSPYFGDEPHLRWIERIWQREERSNELVVRHAVCLGAALRRLLRALQRACDERVRAAGHAHASGSSTEMSNCPCSYGVDAGPAQGTGHTTSATGLRSAALTELPRQTFYCPNHLPVVALVYESYADTARLVIDDLFQFFEHSGVVHLARSLARSVACSSVVGARASRQRRLRQLLLAVHCAQLRVTTSAASKVLRRFGSGRGWSPNRRTRPRLPTPAVASPLRAHLSICEG